MTPSPSFIDEALADEGNKGGGPPGRGHELRKGVCKGQAGGVPFLLGFLPLLLLSTALPGEKQKAWNRLGQVHFLHD